MRYQICKIESNYRDAAGELIQPLVVLGETDDATEAKRLAGVHSESYYGSAIVDTAESTVDWGDCVTGMLDPDYGQTVVYR